METSRSKKHISIRQEDGLRVRGLQHHHTLWVNSRYWVCWKYNEICPSKWVVVKLSQHQGGFQCTQKMAAKCWVASFRWQQGCSRYEGLAILRKSSTFGFLKLHSNGSAWADNTHVETHQINNHPLAFGILLSGNTSIPLFGITPAMSQIPWLEEVQMPGVVDKETWHLSN